MSFLFLREIVLDTAQRSRHRSPNGVRLGRNHSQSPSGNAFGKDHEWVLTPGYTLEPILRELRRSAESISSLLWFGLWV